MTRHVILLAIAAVALVLGGSGAYGATAGFSFGSLHPVFSSFNEYGNALSCPAGSPVSTSTCYLVGEGPGGTPPPGTTAYAGEPKDYTNEIVPVHNGVVGTPFVFANGLAGSQISCPGGSACEIAGYMGATAAPVFIPLNNGAPEAPVSVPLSGHVVWDDIACAGPGDCIGVGWTTPSGASSSTQYGFIVVLKGGHVVSANINKGTGMVNSVSCSSAVLCTAVGSTFSPTFKGHGFFVDISGGKSGALHVLSNTAGLTLVNCLISAGTCLAFGEVSAGSKGILPVQALIKDGSAQVMTESTSTPTLGGIACAALGKCIGYGTVNPNAKGEQGYVTSVSSGGQVGSPALLPGSYSLYTLSCPVVGSCTGVASVQHGAFGDYSIGTFTVKGCGERRSNDVLLPGLRHHLAARSDSQPSNSRRIHVFLMRPAGIEAATFRSGASAALAACGHFWTTAVWAHALAPLLGRGSPQVAPHGPFARNFAETAACAGTAPGLPQAA